VFLDELVNRFQEMQRTLGARTVFGEPYQVNGRTLIPVASVRYGFGMGGGQGAREAAEGAAQPGAAAGRQPVQSGSGGGGGGGAVVKPLAVIEVAGEAVRVRPIVDVTRLATLGMLLAAWNVFWITRTIRAAAAARAAAAPAPGRGRGD